MADEREREKRNLPRDERMKHEQTRQSEGDRSGPSPYDQASPDMPEDRVIEKGKPEKPGPTDQSELRGKSRASTTGAGGGGPSREREGEGELGGEELNERINSRPSDDDTLMGDEESA